MWEVACRMEYDPPGLFVTLYDDERDQVVQGDLSPKEAISFGLALISFATRQTEPETEAR